MDSFKDKVAIVTGGASGIGRALCEELGRRGAVVIVADVNAAGAEQVASSINSNGGSARMAYLDVTQAEDVEKLVNQIASEFGHLDYMFNNAGIAMTGEVGHMNLQHWKRIVDVNLWGVIYGTTAAYRVMSNQGFGYIVNTASAAGLTPTVMSAAYATTKHGVVGLSTSLHAESAAYGVNVSVVCPGYVSTPIYESMELIQIERSVFDKAMEPLKKKGITPTVCARIILDGVVRNKPIIPITSFSRICWLVYRLAPNLIISLVRKSVKKSQVWRSSSRD
ncbi:MAG: SDR family NAD(P)-dependent oxidoreductase [Bacillota bacterium]